MSFMEDLKDFMDKEEVVALGISDEPTFEITSMDQANYYVRKIQELREDANAINETAQTELDRHKDLVERWRIDQLAGIERATAYFEGLLKHFAEKQIEGTNKKSIKLPFGTLAFRAQQPKFTYNDEVVEAYLKDHNPELLNRKEVISIDKKELKKLGTIVDNKLMLNGEIVDGIEIEPQETKFEIK